MSKKLYQVLFSSGGESEALPRLKAWKIARRSLTPVSIVRARDAEARDEPEPLPCWVCGAKPEIERLSVGGFGVRCTVPPSVCDNRYYASGNDLSDATKDWNRKARKMARAKEASADQRENCRCALTPAQEATPGLQAALDNVNAMPAPAQPAEELPRCPDCGKTVKEYRMRGSRVALYCETEGCENSVGIYHDDRSTALTLWRAASALEISEPVACCECGAPAFWTNTSRGWVCRCTDSCKNSSLAYGSTSTIALTRWNLANIKK